MSENSKKNKGIGNVIAPALYMLCFMIVGILCGKYFVDEESFPVFLEKMLIGVFIAYFIYFIHIIVHETGHLVFGSISGYTLSSFRILKFLWQKDDDGKVHCYSFNIAGTGGQCIMVPPEYKESGDNPYFLYNIGGVIFNLLLAAVFGALYYILPNASDLAKVIFLIFVDIGVFSALINGLPLKGLENDGRNIYMLSKSNEAVRAFYIQMKGNALLKKGIRVKDFPEEWFVMPSDTELQNYICAVMAVYICDRYFDEGDYKKAAETIDELLKKNVAFANIHKQLLKNNAMFYAALINDKEKADSYIDDDFKKVSKAMQTNPSILRGQYAYEMLINKDKEEANKKLDMFNKAAENYPYQAEIVSEREAIDKALMNDI